MNSDFYVTLAILIFALCLYFTPAWLASASHKRNKTAIAALNLFLGWTVIGWVVALVWALTKDAPEPARSLTQAEIEDIIARAQSQNAFAPPAEPGSAAEELTAARAIYRARQADAAEPDPRRKAG